MSHLSLSQEEARSVSAKLWAGVQACASSVFQTRFLTGEVSKEVLAFQGLGHDGIFTPGLN